MADRKTCTKCGEEKDISEFTKTTRDGHIARCKSCMLEVQKEWRRNNPEKTKEIRARAFNAWRIKNPKLPPKEPLHSENGRLCRACNVRKSASEFRPDKKTKDGLSYKCSDCKKLAWNNWRSRNVEHVRDYARGQKRKAYAELDKEKLSLAQKRSKLKMKYGVELDEVVLRLEGQGGRCAICGKELAIRQFCRKKGNVACVDHDHDSGKIRGILCSHCNRAIGLMGDSVENLLSAADYLKAQKNGLFAYRYREFGP